MTNLLNVEGKEYTAAMVAAKQFGYTKDYLLLLIKDGKIDGRKVGNKWYVHVPTAETFFKNAVERRKERRKQISLERKSELKSHTRIRFTGNHRTAVLETLAIVIIGLSLGVTGYIGTTTQQTAYVGEEAVNFLERFAVSLYTFVYPDREEAVRLSAEPREFEESTPTTQTPTSEETSFIVAPEDSFSADSAEEIQDSFSDPVEISVDPENPNTGIIVPRFKSGDGEAYRFLMVPVTAEEGTE
jgi:hypothetical protein